MNAKVAVVIPVYNVEPYLRRCVDSVLRQTFRDYDLILVDDGSTDGCGRICDEYAAQDGRVRVIHRKNGGLSAARNTGIDWALANSSAEYLAFVDSDDWVSPLYLEALLRGCDETGCRISAVGIRSVTGETDFPGCGRIDFEKLPVEQYWQMSDSLYTVAWAKLYHRELFGDVRFPVGRLHEDEFTTYRLVFQEKDIAVSAAELYAYYQRQGSISRSRWTDRRMDAIDGISAQVSFFEKRGMAELAHVQRKRLVNCLVGLYELAAANGAKRAVLRTLRDRLGDEWSKAGGMSGLPHVRIRAILYPFRTAAVRLFRSVSRYGIAEALRLAHSGWSRRPYGIGAVAWWRFGLRNPSRLAKGASKVEVVLTMPGGGGAAMYLEKRLSAAPDALATFVVRPALDEGGRLVCEAYRGSHKLRKGLLRSLKDLECLAGRDVTVVVNELVQWHRYWPENVTDERVLEKTVDAVLALKQALSAGLTFLAHDYFCICPRWTLTRDDGVYCADEFECVSCGDCLASGDPAFLYRGGVSVFRWRQVFGRLLAAAEEVRVFSEDTQRRLLRVYPQLKTRCVPHVPNGPALRAPRLSKRPTVIGVFGPQTPSKGARQVAALADYLKKTGHADVRVVVVDRYVREELPDIVEREGINVAFFASVVPETFSYVTQELMMMQLPVVCFDLGAPAERIRKCGRGAVAKEMTAESVWQAILEVMK